METIKDKMQDKEMLAFANGRGLLIPFCNAISPNRAILDVAAQNQSIGLINPEVPRVESLFTNGLLRSSFNIKSEDNKTILKKIHKVVGGKKTSKTFFIYKNGDGSIGCTEHLRYVPLSEDFGFINDAEIQNLNEGDVLHKGEHLQKSINYRKDGICSGKNWRTAYNISPDTIEDSVLISERVAKEMSYYKISSFSVTLDLKTALMRDLYGDENTYKPFPSVGERVDNRCTIMAVSDYNTGYQFIKPKKNMSKISPVDITFHIEDGSLVTDIEVLCARPEAITDMYLKSLHEDNMNYFNEIYSSLLVYYGKVDFDFDANTWFDKTRGITGNYEDKIAGYRRDKNVTPEDHVIVNMSFYEECTLEAGQKITGRYGNKGVVNTTINGEGYAVAGVFKNMEYVDEDGLPIDIILNTLGVPNRSNPAQMYEKRTNAFMDGILTRFRKERESGNIDYDEFREILLTTLKYIAPEMHDMCVNDMTIETLNDILDNDLIVYINPFPQKGWHKIYESNLILRFYLTYKYLNSKGINTDKKRIYKYDENGNKKEMLYKLEVSTMYFRLLEYTAKKKFVARMKGSYNSQGGLTKTQDKKTRQTLRGNTPVKIGERDLVVLSSQLGWNVELLYLFLLQTDSENVDTLNGFCNTLGVELKVDDEIDNRLRSYIKSINTYSDIDE